jgi:hypothetical protein
MDAAILSALIAAAVAAVSALFVNRYRSDRDFRHRFDEHRFTIYSEFARDVSAVLWQNTAANAEMARAKAWVHYESIVLTSSEAVVMACIQVRKALTNHVELLSTFNDETDPDAKTKRESSTNDVYRTLEKFHIAARKEMDLPSLNFGLINEEIRRHYRNY